MLKPNDVFTPGRLPISPTNIYAERGETEDLFRKSLRRAMIPVVYGEYGVGKTSMARYALRDKDGAGLLVNIESVAEKSLDNVFTRCLEKLGYSVRTKKIEGTSATRSHEQSGQAGISAGGWITALIASKRTNTGTSNQQFEEQFSVTSPTDSKLIEICESAGVVLLIDELHRATAAFTSDLSRFIKSYGNANCQNFKIVLLGTSSDASRLVASDPGIDRLIQEIHLKSMTIRESEYIVTKGMTDLSIAIDQGTAERIVQTSVGSPYILQYLSLEVAEAAFPRHSRAAEFADVDSALRTFVEVKEARLLKSYLAAVESTGKHQYRKQVLRAMADSEDDYVTMESIRTKVSAILGRNVPSTALSGPLRELKESRYGPVLGDVERPDGVGRIVNYTMFKDPALKAFIRLQGLREIEELATAPETKNGIMKSGWFELSARGGDQYRFVLKAGNFEIILTSELYQTKSSVENAITSVQLNCGLNERYDRKVASNGRLYFNLRSANNQVIGTSQMYISEASREIGINSVKLHGRSTTIKDDL